MPPASCARMRRPATWRVAALILILAGCARAPQVRPPSETPPPSQQPPPPVTAVPGYEAMVDTLAAIDASGLAGRRIALDPGHGGFFRGALGIHGLTEAEVNLAVGLRLRDLLVARGATVFMTRDTDRDFLTPADSSLKADLAERMRLANAFGPDLFLSIHHNADAGGAHDVNETQTYYKLGDSGPSLDVAQDVHRGLVRNVGIRPHKVVPGNYFVLRNSDAPGILTETSYITNPAVEERLRLPEKQELEAEALCVGLARYFARSVPVITEFRAATDERPERPGASDTVFVDGDPVLRARVTGGYDEAVIDVDGATVEPERIGDRLRWRPPVSWAPGTHEAVLRVRLAGVGAARERRVRFHVAGTPAELRAATWPEAPGRDGRMFGVRVEVRDALGRSCPDSVRVRLRGVRAGGLAPRDTEVTAYDGVAWAYFRLRPVERDGRPRIRVTLAPSTFEVRAETLAVGAGRARAPWTGFVLGGEGAPLRDAPGTREPRRTVGWLTRDGFATIERDSSGALAIPRLTGYRRLAVSEGSAPAFVAIAGGLLAGRRITLDPEGGGEDPAGIGPSGTRGANLNLEVARILAGFLGAAGAEVHLTREGDIAVTDAERVQGSENFLADRYLRIGHRLRRFGYWFGSAAGRQWAVNASAAFAALKLTTPFYGEEAQYPLQQTSCPSLYASVARVDSAADEQALLAPGALRAEAYALFLSLVREFSEPPRHGWSSVDSVEVRDESGRGVPGAIVTLGSALTLETDRSGCARFARTEPGAIEAALDERRARARTVLLDSSRGAVLIGTRGN